MKILLKFPFITITLVVTVCSFLYALLYNTPRCARATKHYTIGKVTTYYSNRFNVKYFFYGEELYTRVTNAIIQRENINISSFYDKKLIVRYGFIEENGEKEIVCSKYVSKVIPEEVIENIEVPEEGWKELPVELKGYLLPK